MSDDKNDDDEKLHNSDEKLQNSSDTSDADDEQPEEQTDNLNRPLQGIQDVSSSTRAVHPRILRQR